ncbi:MAG TPA: NAD(P)/FAD-dependent oxidoreductase [Pyrinomonadaceae bacterium]|nr:NAD(P)/FAD-dependent oxidoreductase [Pyrinomonadaceae bacterium]
MFDAIVVGARCAGSPLAMLLARKGYKVLVVDKAVFPSDTISTHHIHQPGVKKLKDWGILEKVRVSNCPPMTKFRFDVGPFALTGGATPAGEVKEAYVPRRRILDTILADAAVEAGAEFRDGFTVTELLWDGDRVAGIRGRDKNGSIVTEKAKIVIGADGARSFVAKSVKAPVIIDRGLFTCNYYSYFSGIPLEATELYIRPNHGFVADSTNDGLTMVVGIWKQSEFQRVRSNIEEAFMNAVSEQAPSLAERIRDGKREEPFYGAGIIPNFIRKSYGEGWALVGDAGYHKDPVTAQGITDSFTHAEMLAEAIDDAFSGVCEMEEALADYEQKRNEKTMPMFEYTCQLAELAAPPPEMQMLFAALRGNEKETARFFGTVAGTVPVQDFYSPENISRVMQTSTVSSVV